MSTETRSMSMVSNFFPFWKWPNCEVRLWSLSRYLFLQFNLSKLTVLLTTNRPRLRRCGSISLAIITLSSGMMPILTSMYCNWELRPF